MCFLISTPIHCQIFCDIKMEWWDRENRITLIALNKVDMEPIKTLKILHTLGVSQMFVYRTIGRYNETSSVCDRKRSNLQHSVYSVRTKKAIIVVRERIRRNYVRKQKIIRTDTEDNT